MKRSIFARAVRLLSVLLVLLTTMLIARSAFAQVPPHQPGTICFTPYFWCWAQPPGPPGTQCGCPTPQGWVLGVRG